MNKRGGAKVVLARAPTAYNLFVQQRLKSLNLLTLELIVKDLMIKAAAAWTEEKKKASVALKNPHLKPLKKLLLKNNKLIN